MRKPSLFLMMTLIASAKFQPASAQMLGLDVEVAVQTRNAVGVVISETRIVDCRLSNWSRSEHQDIETVLELEFELNSIDWTPLTMGSPFVEEQVFRVIEGGKRPDIRLTFTTDNQQLLDDASRRAHTVCNATSCTAHIDYNDAPFDVGGLVAALQSSENTFDFLALIRACDERTTG